MVEGTAEHIDRRWAWGLISLFVVGVAIWTGLNMSVFAQKIEIAIDREFVWGPDYVMGLFWWVVFAVMIFVFGGESARMLQVAWLGKLLVTLVIMIVYEHFYFLDSYSYFLLTHTGEHWMYPGVDFRNDLMPSPFSTDLSKEQALGGGIGLENTLRFTLLISFISGSFYHALKVWMAFVGFLGVWFFYRAVVVALGRECPSMFFLLAFFPSVIFWGSILGKDPMQLFFLGLYAYGGAIWIVEGRLSAIGFIGLGLLGSYLLRPWASGMAAAVLFLAIILSKCRGIQKVSAVIPIVILAALAGPAITAMNIDPSQLGMDMAFEVLAAKGADFALDTRRGQGSGAELLDATGGMLATPLYVAMFSGLFRPLPFDITNPFTAIAALENTIVLLMAVIGLAHFRLRYLRNPFFLWLVLFTLGWSVLYGYIVMANFGSGVRYKLQVWPFFLMLLICLTRREGRAWLNSWTPESRRSAEDRFG
jgi:hypothetical protein